MEGNAQVYAVLSADPALTALVDDRIWNTNRSEGEDIPACVFRRVTTEYADHSLGSGALAGIRYQIDGYAVELNQAYDVAQAAYLALKNAYFATKLSRNETYNQRTKVYRSIIDVSVWLVDE